ncbi:hemolysin family protein [Kineococcus rubinsiae]|uniref:hemolysin family protein n=1 Tax=Kineococcus rubinsiae TaxID=2609562 RepID=UPI001430E6AD|nr:hemolysin family protein [Kineococcus rubinsiae]NIZ93221.1 HlyC/CorC family transporter [Kineococcus rubinsiae]
MTDVLTLLVGVLVVVAITAVTAYFVAQEFAYMSVDRSQLRAEAADGDPGARRALEVTRRTSFMLSGAQLGITVTGLLVGYVAEPLIGESLGALLGGVGVPTAVSVGVGAVVALVLSTVVQMLFGELFPKNLAIAAPGPVATWLARSTLVYLALFGWLIWFFDQSSNALLRALRIEPVHDVDSAATARDLEHIVETSRDSGDLSAELAVVLDRILDFPRRDAEHAMVPRSRVDTVTDTDDLALVRALMAIGHSRYPVLSADRGDVVGVVHLEDLLTTTEPGSAPVTSIVRPALVVATVSLLPDVLRELTTTGDELACVVDEHGGLAGIVTVEDLAEELVGEIADEHDEAAPQDVVVGADGPWEVSGDVHVDEVERALGIDLPRGEHETIAGLVIAAHGGLPPVGAELLVDLPADPGDLDDAEPRRLRVTVLTVERFVPARVRLELPPPTTVDESATTTTEETR